jgi:hypothetical protein
MKAECDPYDLLKLFCGNRRILVNMYNKMLLMEHGSKGS